MKNLKKVTALILILCLTFCLIGNALAGSLMDTIINAGKTVWNGLRTAGNAVVDTMDYVFTDDDAATAYADTKKAATDTKDTALDTADTAKKIVTDAVDVAEGTAKVAEGLVDLARNGHLAGAINYITGDGDVDPETWKAMEKMVKGYDQLDNGLILDVVKCIPGWGTVAAGAIEGAKAGAEYATGHITEKEFRKECQNAFVDMTVGAVAGGAGAAVNGTAAKLGVKAAGAGVGAALKEK